MNTLHLIAKLTPLFMMKKCTQLLMLFSFLILLSCGQEGFENQGAKEDVESSSGPKQTDKKAAKSSPRKLIKEGQVSFQTTDMDAARANIVKATSQFQGYISSEQLNSSTHRVSNTMVVRIPTTHFEAFLKAATVGIASFDYKSISAKDVTEEFLDTQARLKAKKALENRFLDLLSQANSIEEILRVEREAGKLRSEIEVIEGRLRFLENKISLSTLTLTFYQKASTSTWLEFKQSFLNGWDNVISFFIALTNLWPFILLSIAIFFGVRFYKRRG